MALMADFQQFYGLDLADLWRGTLSARRALILVGHLDDIVESRYRALKRGGLEHLGWGIDRHIAADTRDMLLAIGAGLGGEKTTAADMWPRPQSEADAPVEVGTIADFDEVGFMRMIAGR